MIESAYDLRRHVSWCPRCLIRIFLFLLSGNSKIRDPYISSILKDKIFWLQISMYDVVIVDVFQPKDDTGYDEF